MLTHMRGLFHRTWREMPAAGTTPAEKWLWRAGYWLGDENAPALSLLGARLYDRLDDVLCSALLPDVDRSAWPVADRSLAALAKRVRGLAEPLLLSYRQLPLSVTQRWAQGKEAWRQFARWSEKGDTAAAFRSKEAVQELVAAVGVPMTLLPDLQPAGDDAVALVVPDSDGPARWLACDRCDYAASERAATNGARPPSGESLLPAEEIETPHCATIADLAAFLHIPANRTAKALFLVGDGQRYLVVVRGDSMLNEAKLKRATGVAAFRPATEEEILAGGAVPGYASPVGLERGAFRVVIDYLVAHSPNLVAGANKPGYHLLNSNFGRDYDADLVVDLVQAEAGDRCPSCGEGHLSVVQGYAMGEWAYFTGPSYLNAQGRPEPAELWAGQISMAALATASAALHHDEHGLRWPPRVAPYDVYLVSLAGKDAELQRETDALAEKLSQAGWAVLYDDRTARAGVKFNDADLLGMPWQVVVGRKWRQTGLVEVRRRGGDRFDVPAEQLIEILAKWRE